MTWGLILSPPIEDLQKKNIGLRQQRILDWFILMSTLRAKCTETCKFKAKFSEINFLVSFPRLFLFRTWNYTVHTSHSLRQSILPSTGLHYLRSKILTLVRAALLMLCGCLLHISCADYTTVAFALG